MEQQNLIDLPNPVGINIRENVGLNRLNDNEQKCCPNKFQHMAGISYLFGLITIGHTIIALYLTFIYVYQPSMSHYHETTCMVNSCSASASELVCCSKFIFNQCTSKYYANLTFTLILDQRNYTKYEVHICNGPWGQDSWQYTGICNDPPKTINCYYDDRDISDSLHLTTAFQSPPPIINIFLFAIYTFLIIMWLFYLFTYCCCYCKNC